MTRHVNNGDIILTGKQSQGLVSLVIKLGSKLRYGFKSPFTIYSHTAIVYDAELGLVVEAVSHGVVISKLAERFPEGDFDVLHTEVNEHDWKQIEKFLNAVVEAKWRYGFVTFLGLAIYCLTGGALCIQKAGTSICSGLVCDALTRAGYVWNRPPYSMMPADIADQFVNRNY